MSSSSGMGSLYAIRGESRITTPACGILRERQYSNSASVNAEYVMAHRPAPRSSALPATDHNVLRLLIEIHICTRNQRLATIHSLARFIGERSPEHVSWCGQIRTVPFKRSLKNSLSYLEKDEIDALLAAPDRSTSQGQRDYAVLLFLYNSGARASEAAGVLVEHLEPGSTGSGSVKLHGKGRKIRFCPLWTKTMNALLPLTHGRSGTAPLFLNRYGEPITRFGIHTLVERHARSAAKQALSLRKKRISPHTIRHTTATHLLRAGVDINTIRCWLGHVSLETTNVYAETDLAIKAKALSTCDPGSGTAIKKKWRDDPSLMKFLRGL